MNDDRLDVKALSARERRFLFGYLLSGNASASYLAIITQVGSQAEHAHQAASRMLARVKRKISWPLLLENLEIGALNLVRELEAELRARGTAEGDGAALLLGELLRARGTHMAADSCKTAGGTLAAGEDCSLQNDVGDADVR